ncbi:MAG: hypothetical protein NXI22_25465, partial [bacterium]|nr:hypothetical protein [bacterium]
MGLEELIDRHREQIATFEVWANSHDWDQFHDSHYDWWTFPIDQPSSHGHAWTVYEGEVADLRADSAFVDRYLLGVELVSASWGWDVRRRKGVNDTHPNQKWNDWPVRLYKAVQSTKLFGFNDFHLSLKEYGQRLIRCGKSMEFRGKDLSEYL